MASPLFLSFCNICKSNYKLLTLFLWEMLRNKVSMSY